VLRSGERKAPVLTPLFEYHQIPNSLGVVFAASAMGVADGGDECWVEYPDLRHAFGIEHAVDQRFQVVLQPAVKRQAADYCSAKRCRI
jgi:hypothetical protein